MTKLQNLEDALALVIFFEKQTNSTFGVIKFLSSIEEIVYFYKTYILKSTIKTLFEFIRESRSKMYT